MFVLGCNSLFAQKTKTNSTKNKNIYPTSFTINKSDFDRLLNTKANQVFVSKENKYLDKSAMLMNTKNGDTKFMKIKLNYFPKAYLMIQVNGEYSTQVFILSDDKSVFYKGRAEKNTYLLNKCSEDEIVSE
jgi:hypothetical protein